MAAPVMVTEAKPSASGSAAAASDPNTASRISSTIGKPVTSAFSRSSLARSCMPAHRASWPTVYSSTPSRAPSPTSSSSRRSTARSLAWSWSASTVSGSVTTGDRAAWRLARAAARGESSACGSSAATRSTRSTAARTSASDAPGRRATITARLWDCARSNSARPRSTASESEPGTAKPPLVRCSVWRMASGAAATSSTSHTAMTIRRRRSITAVSRSIAACMWL